ncbi:SPS1 Serine-threonine protein kinase [Pyrenophora tritici-repentis]|nr:SPS1 Serine-threonine protein kinase [Pyrenophora tritici-repentis]
MATRAAPNELRDFLDQLKQWTLFAANQSLPAGGRAFISIHQLKRYLDKERLRKLLFYVQRTSHNQEVIQDKYIVVFAILLKIGKGAYISHFTSHDSLADDRLPFEHPNGWFGESTSFFEEFYKAQWPFCAKRLERGRFTDKCVPEEMVIPFKRMEVLKQGPNSTVFRVEVFPEYNYLTQDEHDKPTTNVFILKSCRSNRRKFYDNEVETYRALSNHPTGGDALQYIAHFYGSWTQGDTCNILREYVGGGTLTEYFNKTEPPMSKEHILKFWENFIQITKPIASIHHYPDPANAHSYQQGLHNDIKPDNILVSEPYGESPYDVFFKLSDLGLAGYVLASDSDHEVHSRDVHGTQMYSAPEYFRGEGDSFKRQSIKQANPSKDIWSLACMLSEAATWSVFGAKGWIDYHDKRKTATSAVPSIRNTAYSGCFHDGTKVLPVVRTQHREVIHKRRINIDGIMPEVIHTIEKMMGHKDYRPTALAVYEHITEALDLARPLEPTAVTQSPAQRSPPPVLPHEGLGLRIGQIPMQSPTHHFPSPSNIIEEKRKTSNYVPRTPGSASRVMSYRYDSPSASPMVAKEGSDLPYANIDGVLEWISKKKSSSAVRLKDQDWLHRLHGRDQIFLIDDSNSMKKHWEQVRRVFEALAYLVKELDPDGIELRFTNNCSLDDRSKDRRNLIRTLKRVTPSGQCQMGLALSKILPRYPQNQPDKRSSWRPAPAEKTGMNIYIFTDGVWSKENNCVETTVQHIELLVDKLVQSGQLQGVGIQFIRFGDDQVGRERLDFLDNDGLQNYRVATDIVDTEPATGNVFKMLLASTDRSWDVQYS